MFRSLSILLVLLLAACATKEQHSVGAPPAGGSAPMQIFRMTAPPPVRYCAAGETLNCKQLGAADNGAVVRGHSDDSNKQDIQ